MVEVTIPGRGVLQFISTHLDFGRNVENRTAQAESLNRLIVQDDRPSILAGDMNSRVDSEAMQILAMRWTNAAPPIQRRPFLQRAHKGASITCLFGPRRHGA